MRWHGEAGKSAKCAAREERRRGKKGNGMAQRDVVRKSIERQWQRPAQ